MPLQFLHALLDYLGDSVSYFSPLNAKSPLASTPSTNYQGIGKPSEGIIIWQLRLEYFAYETLQDLRIAKLFEIIVDYPDRLVFFQKCFKIQYKFRIFEVFVYLQCSCD